MLKRKIKKKHLKIIGVCSLVIITNLTVFSVMQYKLNKNNKFYETEVSSIEDTTKDLNKKLLVPVRDIEKGSKLSVEEDFMSIEVKTDIDSEVFANREDIKENGYARIDLNANYPIYKSMLYSEEISDTDRIEEFNMFLLQSDIQEGDYVDIRIFYPTGENYIVLDKKRIEKLDLENNTIWLRLDEKEINYISSAIIDNYITGSKIYVNKYIEPNVQEDAIPNYLPNEAVLDLIDRNPNILFEIKNGIEFESLESKRGLLDLRLESLEDDNAELVEQGVEEETQKREEIIDIRLEKEEEQQEKEDVKDDGTSELNTEQDEEIFY